MQCTKVPWVARSKLPVVTLTYKQWICHVRLSRGSRVETAQKKQMPYPQWFRSQNRLTVENFCSIFKLPWVTVCDPPTDFLTNWMTDTAQRSIELPVRDYNVTMNMSLLRTSCWCALHWCSGWVKLEKLEGRRWREGGGGRGRRQTLPVNVCGRNGKH